MGTKRRNFAIQTRPPLGSYQYDFVRGLPYAQTPEYPRRTRSDADKAYDALGSIANVSNSDFDASAHWMTSLAEQVAYLRKTRPSALDERDLELWAAIWKRWLLLSAQMKRDLTAQSIVSPQTHATHSQVLNDALAAYRRFRRLGLGQVALPYIADIVSMLRTLPAEMTLTQMVTRLREAAKAGDRLIATDTAWTSWRTPGDAADLKQAVHAARVLADKFEEASRLPNQKSPREKGSFAYDLFLRAVVQIPLEAGKIYIVDPPSVQSVQPSVDTITPKSGKRDVMLAALLVSVGYFGYKWWTKPPRNILVGNNDYNQQVDEEDDFDQEEENADPDPSTV